MDAPAEDPTIADESRGEGRAEKVCATCGTTIDASEWHPTRTTVDGEVEVYLFCSEQCRDAWSATGRETGDATEDDEVSQ